jgi:hypothetical protein
MNLADLISVLSDSWPDFLSDRLAHRADPHGPAGAGGDTSHPRTDPYSDLASGVGSAQWSADSAKDSLRRPATLSAYALQDGVDGKLELRRKSRCWQASVRT